MRLFLLLLLLIASCTSSSTVLPLKADVSHQVLATVRLTKVAAFLSEDGIRILGAVATGVLVDSEVVRGKRENLVMTAKHWCETPTKVKFKDGKTGLILGAKVNAVNYKGQEFEVALLAMHKDDDICFVTIEGDVGETIAMAEAYPSVGSTVMHVGAPEGNFGLNLAYIVDGRFCGLEEVENVLYTMASISTVGGSSGGGIYYDGKLISILVRSNFSGISLGVPLHRIRSDLDTIRPLWRAKRLSVTETSASSQSTKP